MNAHRLLGVVGHLAERGIVRFAPKYVERSIVEAIRLLIRHRLDQRWSAGAVAAALGMSEATLRRRLAAEGRSLRAVMLGERMEAARLLLSERTADVAQACRADLEALLPLIHAHAVFERSAASATVDALRTALSGTDPRLRAWVAEEAGRPIGYATATREFATWTGRAFVHLDCLFVEEGQRGRAVGQQLFDAVRTHAAEIGLSPLKWTTPAWNEGGQRFYLRQGATALPQVRFVLDVPAHH